MALFSKKLFHKIFVFNIDHVFSLLNASKDMKSKFSF
jgi:hypothetical protein